MTKEKFTQGNWELDDDGHVVIDLGDDVWEIICDMCDPLNEEEEANASLITAAPEMYNMLKDFVAYVEGDCSEDFLYRYHEIKELLAKARGEKTTI